jgi:hypothetical protein
MSLLKRSFWILLCCHCWTGAIGGVDTGSMSFGGYYGVDGKIISACIQPHPPRGHVSPKFYDGNIPPDLSSSFSFVVSSPRGSGKTNLYNYLRNELMGDEDVIYVEPFYGYSFDLALQTFTGVIPVFPADYEEMQTKIISDWTNSDMVDYLMVQLSSNVLDLLANLPVEKLSVVDRAVLLFITGLYLDLSPEELAPLGKLISAPNGAQSQSLWCIGFDDDLEYQTIPEHQTLLKMADTIHISQNFNLDRLLALTYTLKKHFKTDPARIIERMKFTSRINMLVAYLQILGRLGKTVTFAIDGIDDVNGLGISEAVCSSDAFTGVIRSFEPLLALANNLALNLQVFMFIPECQTVASEEVLPPFKFTKVKFRSLKWTPSSLAGYGEHLLASWRAERKRLATVRRYNKLPNSFADLMGGKDCSALFLAAVSQPREFNALLSKFIQLLNNEKFSSRTPYRGEAENCSTVKQAIVGAVSDGSISRRTSNSPRQQLLHDEL